MLKKLEQKRNKKNDKVITMFSATVFKWMRKSVAQKKYKSNMIYGLTKATKIIETIKWIFNHGYVRMIKTARFEIVMFFTISLLISWSASLIKEI